MVQIARPTADITVTNWTTLGGASIGLAGQIKEENRNDAERIVTVLDPSPAVYVVRLSSFVMPTLKTGWVLDYAYRKDAADGDDIDLTVELRQGYVSEGTPGTLIASAAHAAIPAAFTVGALALSEAEATSVTDPTVLFVRFVASTAPFRESFNQADSTTLGPDLSWTEITGDLQTVGNRVRMVTPGAGAADSYARADADVATSDMYAKVRIITFPNTGTEGISQRTASACARCDATGAETFYMARLIYFLNTDQYEYHLNKVVAGVVTQLGSSVVVTPAFPETVEVRCVGDQISCLRNDLTIIGPITDTAIPTGSRAGIRLWERTAIANTEVDDFETGAA